MPTETVRLPARLHALATMAALLERLERQPRSASAGQYRGVVQQIRELLAEAEGDESLPALLAIAPATAELYENLHYEHAGLCRSPLEEALNAELAASTVIKAARSR
ncbi:hypothetical protein EV684_10315 [Rubrivivax gelatinosus]|uniref:Uncharacterized protein n=2 Tax=Rubrivivax gelatinosus TaxID=28068 RepID=A0A4R2MBU0_RUBGE|nr:hypothetical protein [Rubrivivax gelatinosus]TCP03771.1 hypothetical protein EV684_10315 [Rubrivivax gelatinosus]